MMAKMYYSEPETCEKLGVDTDGLMEFVNSGRLQMYQDGPKHVYKATDVDALCELAASGKETDELSLAETVITESVAHQDTSDFLSLAEVDIEVEQAPEIRKEDTVITAEGISIFDDEDLEIEEADPMAKTQIAPSLDDQIALDGIGSGSGLLDLTRESDDTSLGAEVLEHIDMDAGSGLAGGFGTEAGLSGGFGTEAGLSGGFGTGLSGGFNAEVNYEQKPAASKMAPVMTEPPVFVEPTDGSTGFFTGMVIGISIVAMLVVAITMSAFMDVESEILRWVKDKTMIILIAGALAALIIGFIGMFIGKSMQKKREMLEKMGG